MNDDECGGADKCASAEADQDRLAERAAGNGSPAPCWPQRHTSTVNSSSFFQQLFADDEDTGAVVDGLLLMPAPSTAFDAVVEEEDKFSADTVFQLGEFPIEDSFMDTPSVVVDTPAAGSQPHTLQFVSSPNHSADAPSSADHDFGCLDSSPRYSNSGPRRLPVHPPDSEIQQETTSLKKPKVLAHADSHGSTLVDRSPFQSLVTKVNYSQSTRSKEKLSERINALQQLVSPFGKTDTASVLSEAIGYIKFLQQQVQVLSSPYLKPTSTLPTLVRQDVAVEAASDLRSRGLCLVPVSCTMSVADNNNFNIGADYWASTQNLSSSVASSGTTSARFSIA